MFKSKVYWSCPRIDHKQREKYSESKELAKQLIQQNLHLENFFEFSEWAARFDDEKQKETFVCAWAPRGWDSQQPIREKVIKQKISLFNQSWEGVRAWDLMLSLAGTCKKNGVSFFQIPFRSP